MSDWSVLAPLALYGLTDVDMAPAPAANDVLAYSSGVGWVNLTLAALTGLIDHGGLTGLADDDHAQYALLAGRAGGQTLKGGTAASQALTLQSTSNATRGRINLGSAGTSYYDEVAQALTLANPLAVTSGGLGLAAVALGDLYYGSGANAVSRLAGNTTTTRKWLRQVGDGVASAAPAWDTLQAGDLPVHVHAAGDITSGQLALARGGTAADLSATGGAGQYVKQAGVGAAFTVGAIAAGDLPTGIDAAKLADGSVSNAEFQRLDGVTSGIQGQLDGKQPLDATLTSLAGLGTAADRLAYTTGVDTWAETPLTAAGRALIDDASAADQRTTLGLTDGAAALYLATLRTTASANWSALGCTICAADLLRVLGSTPTVEWWHDGVHVARSRYDGGSRTLAFTAHPGNGVASGDLILTCNGNTVWHAGNDGAGSGLDADTVDGQHAAAFAAASHTHAANDIVSGTLALARGGAAADLSATGPGALVQTSAGAAVTVETLDETRGGTGLAAYSTGDVLYASAANTLARLAAGSNGQVLTLAAGVPSWATPAGVSDGDKGDITVSGSGATWTIDADAVTYAKMQNVSATDKLLGRATAGAGDVEEIACTSFARSLLDDADAATARTTLGAAATSHTHETDDLTRLGWSMSDTGGYSLATATTYDYTFTASEEDFDTNSFHADGGSTCTVPTGGAGLYLIHGWSYITALAAGAAFDVDIAINDVTYKSGIYRWQGVGNASINQCSGVSAIVALADGDTVELRLWHNHGSNRTVYGSLSGVRLCA